MLSLFAREGSWQPSWSRPARADTSAEFFFCEMRWNRRRNWRQAWNFQEKQNRLSWQQVAKNNYKEICKANFMNLTGISNSNDRESINVVHGSSAHFSGFMTCSFQICLFFPTSSSSSLEGRCGSDHKVVNLSLNLLNLKGLVIILLVNPRKSYWNNRILEPFHIWKPIQLWQGQSTNHTLKSVARTSKKHEPRKKKKTGSLTFHEVILVG